MNVEIVGGDHPSLKYDKAVVPIIPATHFSLRLFALPGGAKTTDIKLATSVVMLINKYIEKNS